MKTSLPTIVALPTLVLSAILAGCGEKAPPSPPATTGPKPQASAPPGNAAAPVFTRDAQGNAVPASGTQPRASLLPEGVTAVPTGIGAQSEAAAMAELRTQVRGFQKQLADALAKQQDTQAAMVTRQKAAWAEQAAQQSAAKNAIAARNEANKREYLRQKAEYDAKMKELAGKSQDELAAAGVVAPQEPLPETALPETAPTQAVDTLAYNPQAVRDVESLTYQFRRQLSDGQRAQALATFSQMSAMAERLPPPVVACLQDEIRMAFPAVAEGSPSNAGVSLPGPGGPKPGGIVDPAGNAPPGTLGPPPGGAPFPPK